MTGAMYASIAGLKTHMQKLSVIGNNVANVNTAGYKTHRTVFRDTVYSMYSSGSNGSDVVGGMNPSQIGYGSVIGSIDLDMSTSSYNPGNPTDVALTGDGFFLVGDKEIANNIDPQNPETFKSLNLTRVGDFFFGPDGYLVDGAGSVVYGFMNTNDGAIIGADGKTSPDISDQLVGIRLPLMEKAYYKVDEKGEITGDPVKKSEAIGADGKLKDGFKIEYTIRYPVTKPADDNNQGGTGGTDTVTNDIPLKNYEAPTGADDTDQTTSTVDLSWAQLESIEIDKATGAITGTTKEGGIPVTVGYLAIGNVTNPNGVSHKGNSYYQAGAGAGDLMISMLGGVNQQLGIFNVNGSLYRTTGDNNQGGDEGPVLPTNSEVTSAGDTKLMTGFLEAPNVDLATEISELITTQRGYQANTRIITVTDSMLEELVNMKR